MRVACYPAGPAENVSRCNDDGAREGSRGARILAKDFEQTLRSILIRDLALTPPLKVQVRTPLRDAIARMQEMHRPCLIVCKDEKVAGIFTERDVLYKLTAPGADLEQPIDGVMTPEPRTLHPEDPVSTAIRLMTEQSYRHIPLTDASGNCVGFVTARDIIVYIAEHFPAEVLNLPMRLGQVPQRAEGG